MFSSPEIFYFSAALIMITVCVFGAIIKGFHICYPYRADADKLFPARKLLVVCLILHLLFVPYLLNVGTVLGVRYATTMLLITHPFIYSLLIDTGFFLRKLPLWSLIGAIILLSGLIIMPLMYYIEANGLISAEMLRFMRMLPSGVFVVELVFIFAPIRKLTIKIAQHNRENYSSSKDFPFPMATLTLIPAYLYTIYILVMYFRQDENMLMIFNVIFAVTVCLLVLYTLNPLRDLSQSSEMRKIDADVVLHKPQEDGALGEKELEEVIEEARSRELVDDASLASFNNPTETEQKIIASLENLLVERQLFKLSYLKITDVYPLLGVSKHTLTMAITKSHYGSFYNLINSFRLQYAMELMQKMSDFKLQNISIEAGFGSPSQFSQFFKERTGDTPTRWLRKQHR